MDNPMHRVQRWTGTHFRAAELWEVGTYVLVPHHTGEHLCDTLSAQKRHLEEFERQKDTAEQEHIERSGRPAPMDQSAQPSTSRSRSDDESQRWEIPQNTQGRSDPSETLDEEAFEKYLDDLREGRDHVDPMDESLFLAEADDTATVDHADANVRGLPHYLDQSSTNITFGAEEGSTQMPRVDMFHNSYVRIVHTNGLHHLAMVSCQCRGADLLPLDLIACRLLPASFVNIRTLFSTQLLDQFRLCNLELKASAYQFYQLLRRLTSPMAPAEVVDLYNEFRRMTRLWRWMKKLKWAGFGHNGKTAKNVTSGELANYCPACPQPGINLPDNWKEDLNRSDISTAVFHSGN